MSDRPLTLRDVLDRGDQELRRRADAWRWFYEECAEVPIATRKEPPPHALDEADRP